MLQSSKPLAGLHVVEMGSVVLAPYAAQVLADLGANIIKIEPIGGDATRKAGTLGPGGTGSLFLNCNRGKRSLAVDLKHPEGRGLVRELLARADVLLHNMRSDAIARLGFDFASVHALNPRLVYCSAYGYGGAGRYSDRPAYDDIIQAASGVAAIKGRIDGKPAYAPTILADKTTALFAVIGIQAALARRAHTGIGEELEVAMFETMVNFVSVEHLDGFTFDPPRGTSGYDRLMTDFRRPHRTRDGYLAVLPYNAQQWESFFTAAGRAELVQDPRFADDASRSRNIGLLYEQVATILVERTCAEWEAMLLAFDIPHARVNDIDDLVNDAHLRDVGFWHRYTHQSEEQLRVPAFPVKIGGPKGSATPALSVPQAGEHTGEILDELGYSPLAIEDLVNRAVVAT